MNPEAISSLPPRLSHQAIPAPAGYRLRRIWMARVEKALFVSMGGYFALSLLNLASLA
jgi:hypothetical protein